MGSLNAPATTGVAMHRNDIGRVLDYATRIARARFRMSEQEAEDVAQEVLIAWWHKYQLAPPPPGWLYGTILHQCQMLLRAAVRRRGREAEYGRRREQYSQTDPDLLLDAGAVLEKALGVKGLDRARISGEPLAALAARCNLPVGTLYRRLNQWRRLLRRREAEQRARSSSARHH